MISCRKYAAVCPKIAHLPAPLPRTFLVKDATVIGIGQLSDYKPG